MCPQSPWAAAPAVWVLLAVAQPVQFLEEVAVTPSSLMPWAAVAVAADAWAVAGAGLSEEQVMV